MLRRIKVLAVESPHFTIKLYEGLLKIDLKGSLKIEIEEALEKKPVLKETLGSIVIPLERKEDAEKLMEN